MLKGMLRPGLVCALALVPATASAHPVGFPTTVSAGQSADAQSILVETTFGLVVSHDGGASFHWICEEAADISGALDPQIAVTRAGTFFVTTFDGLQVSRDGGCSWAQVDRPDLDDRWAPSVHVSKTGEVWTLTSGEAPNVVLASTDDGVTFREVTPPEATDVVWRSVLTAPEDATRVYVTGLRVVPPTEPGALQTEPVVFRSSDGGQAWTALGWNLTTGEPGTKKGTLLLLGAGPDPDLVFGAYDVFASGSNLSVLVRSDDGGATWTEVLSQAYAPEDDEWPFIGFHAFADDTRLWVGSPKARGYESIDKGLTWTERAADADQSLGCVLREPSGDLLACGHNWDPDFAALGRSTDGGESFDSIFRFSQMRGPLDCAPGTTSARICEPLWPMIAQQFGIAIEEPTTPDASPATPDATITEPPEDDPRCGCGVVLGLGLVLPFGFRRPGG